MRHDEVERGPRWGLLEFPRAGAIAMALSVLVAGALLGLAILRLADSHGDLRRACLEGGGSSFDGGVCYHKL